VNLTLAGMAIWIGSGMLSLPWRKQATGAGSRPRAWLPVRFASSFLLFKLYPEWRR